MGVDRQRGLVDLADLAVGCVHMDQLLFRIGRLEQAVAIGRRFAEARAEREDYVGIADHPLHVR